MCEVLIVCIKISFASIVLIPLDKAFSLFDDFEGVWAWVFRMARKRG